MSSLEELLLERGRDASVAGVVVEREGLVVKWGGGARGGGAEVAGVIVERGACGGLGCSLILGGFQLISMDKPLEELDEDFQLIAMDKRLEELDEDVLYWILNYCSLHDYIRMGAVCKSWLSISKWSIGSHPPQLPWLMMLSNPDSTSVEEDRCFFSLSDSTIYDAIKFPEICGKRCCGSFSWVVNDHRR
ncbi:hypothetical protein MRB53_024790 [Persea americana]|uniref:Uncharacterized protein n=1 Tax=Persea americana TaxID=3435 RepID=A0ACC2LD73_PERAE|nr:hypothetical protein MRB53_024790 [Persea americana]